jgi:hypothetical protein
MEVTMTKKMMTWFITQLAVNSLGIKQVEPYEGQFEDPEDVSVFPPAAFIVIQRLANNATQGEAEREFSVSVYLVTNHIAGTSADGMLDLIDSVIETLHDKGVRYNDDKVPAGIYFGRCLWLDGDFIGILPGMAVYKMNFTVRK